MVKVPVDVPISPALHKKLLSLDSDMKAIQQMMQMFQQSCQSRLVETQNAARSTWAQIEAETGIDLKNVSWEPHPRDAVVVATQMRLIG